MEFIEVKNEFGAVGLVPLKNLKLVGSEKKSRRIHVVEEDESARRDEEEHHQEGGGEAGEGDDSKDLWSRTKDNLKKKVDYA